MSANSRFSVSIHIMTSLAYSGGEGSTSNILAQGIKTNPVVIRRLLSQLHHAGLVTCQPGKSGGCHLARAPEQISLQDVYMAIEQGGPFVIPQKTENKACEVSCQMKGILTDVFEQTQQAIAQRLKRITLADLVKTVRQASAA
jgi:Rrf2 family protein